MDVRACQTRSRHRHRLTTISGRWRACTAVGQGAPPPGQWALDKWASWPTLGWEEEEEDGVGIFFLGRDGWIVGEASADEGEYESPHQPPPHRTQRWAIQRPFLPGSSSGGPWIFLLDAMRCDRKCSSRGGRREDAKRLMSCACACVLLGGTAQRKYQRRPSVHGVLVHPPAPRLALSGRGRAAEAAPTCGVCWGIWRAEETNHGVSSG